MGKEPIEEGNEKERPTELEEEVFVASGVFQNGRVLVTGRGASILFNTGFYGELKDPNTLHLSDVEATNLIERKRLVVLDEETSSPLTLQQIVHHFAMKNNEFWVNYLVYKDLRMRGYVVRIGFKDPILFRVYHRGGQPGQDPAKLFVAPMVEGKRLPLETLEYLFSIALAARKQLLLAVIDRSGDVTYYRAQEIDL
ncbi:MAG: tRNA-intron lyase [Candidatus Hodarchaeota archaeon]